MHGHYGCYLEIHNKRDSVEWSRLEGHDWLMVTAIPEEYDLVDSQTGNECPLLSLNYRLTELSYHYILI